MTIKGFSSDDVDQLLAKHLTPSDVVTDPTRLIGREGYLRQVKRALASPGRHIFVHGERGVGKTSLAMTAGILNAPKDENFIYVPCGEQTSFFEVIQTIGNSVLELKDRLAAGGSGWGAGGGLNIPGLAGAHLNYKSGTTTSIAQPTNWSEVE